MANGEMSMTKTRQRKVTRKRVRRFEDADTVTVEMCFCGDVPTQSG